MAIGVTELESDQASEAIRVSVPDRGLKQDARAISIVWRRELIRFRSDRLRAVTSLVQPVLFLFVLWRTFTVGAKAANNPWGEGATTLEWTLTSPPPVHAFEELPEIK